MHSPRLALFGLLALLPAGVHDSELPLGAWGERLEQVESLVLEYDLLSAEEEHAQLRFVYRAPDRCFLSLLSENDKGMQLWLDAGVMTLRARGPEKATSASFDLGELFEETEAWLADFQAALPRDESPRTRDYGPHFDFGVSVENDKVECKLSYVANSDSVLGWLVALDSRELPVTALEDGFRVQLDESARLELEQELGVIRSAWVGSGEDERQAIELTGMTLDSDVQGAFEISEPDDDMLDQSGAIFGEFKQLGWKGARNQAHAWLWGRGKHDQIDLSAEEESLVRTAFADLHMRHAEPLFERWRQDQEASLDEFSQRVETWLEEEGTQPGALDYLEQLKQEARSKWQERLDLQRDSFLEAIEAPEVNGAQQADLEQALELESQAAASLFDEHYIEHVLRYLDELLAELG